MEFATQEDLQRFLASVKAGYGRYAAELWRRDVTTTLELAAASIEDLEAAGVARLHANAIKLKASQAEDGKAAFWSEMVLCRHCFHAKRLRGRLTAATVLYPILLFVLPLLDCTFAALACASFTTQQQQVILSGMFALCRCCTACATYGLYARML
jgi:hypothetical protein